MDRLSARVLAFAMLLLIAAGSAAAGPLDERRDELEAFSREMAREHGLDREALRTLLMDEARHQPGIIEAITTPAEALPWHRYRRIFLKEDRINEGAAFVDEHAGLLRRVEEEYGVDRHIIAAVIGIETRYGRHRGEHRVLDALVTLAFDYPPRADFFRSELEAFLLLAREEGLETTEVRGSYAGAMGIPQFIASSYRHYAVDGNGNGRRNLLDSVPDAVASVANYFREHDWRRGEPVAAPARLADGADPEPFLDDGMRLNTTVGALRDAGIETDAGFPADARALLLELDTDDGTAYWVGLHNFRVITRYNHSPLYALAALQLAGAIEESGGQNE
ncbi:lytic murein transglycosylase B [Aquisalimonas lutea]|uniref:lytic murein transglycosylase B n=1 Tax=Aquisalimonas lutea TaxID=1327750 RepID=UPI0025B31D2E|nr:lytic murein transglycosylase B [Aquisalimonas lutea]MDN3516036.1 lytic murein transglycosylase B [Aquisalimonas lutea]